MLEISSDLAAKDYVEIRNNSGGHEHQHSNYGDYTGHRGGNHSHSAFVKSPYSHVLYKYDTFVASNPNGTPWHARLTTPVSGLHPVIYVREYNPQTGEWINVGQSVMPIVFGGSWIEWTPVSGRTYSVTATLLRGFTESLFTLTYDFASGSDSQGLQPQTSPSDLAPSQIKSMLGAIEDMRLGDGEDVSRK